MRIALEFTCPKRKCRHAWDAEVDDVIVNQDCPDCGAADLCPISIDTVEDKK